MCIDTNELSLFDNLSLPLELNSMDRSLWNDRCDYMDLHDCENLNPKNNNLVILQLNIRSFLSNQTDLRRLLINLEAKNSKIDIALLSETHLVKNTVGFVNIPYYSHIANFRTSMKGGGTSILVQNNIPFRRRKHLKIFEEKLAESTYIEVTAKSGKQYVIGSLYHSPNTTENTLIDHLKETVYKIQTEGQRKEVILGMDHNMDLLKSQHHTPTQHFLQTVLDCNMLPTITRPSRITKNSATLINNIFVSKFQQRNFYSCLLIDDTLDHFPTLALLKQT